MGRLKVFWLILLAATAVAVLSAGTLAAYNQTMELSGTIRAARFVFNVNGSGEETQSLGVRELAPGGSPAAFDVVIDTRGAEVAMDVALNVSASGSDLPPGLSILVDGEPIGSSGTGSRTATYSGMKDSCRTVPIVVSWNATKDELLALYQNSRNFTLSLSASVTATQAE